MNDLSSNVNNEATNKHFAKSVTSNGFDMFKYRVFWVRILVIDLKNILHDNSCAKGASVRFEGC